MKGISFSPDMVRAIRNTRRNQCPAWPVDPSGPFKWKTRRLARKGKKPRYQVDEVLYIKEGLARRDKWATYRADNGMPVVDGTQVLWRWQRDNLPSRFMPKACAREYIQIVQVEMEGRLEMTGMECVYEGLLVPFGELQAMHPDGYGATEEAEEYIRRFGKLWDGLHGKGSFVNRPPVWCYSFKRL